MNEETRTDESVEATDGAGGDAALDPDAATQAGELTGVAEFRASVDDARETLRRFLGGDGGSKLQLLGDAVALAGLGAMLVWMTTHDGGWERYFFQLAATAVLVASPIAVAEAGRLPRAARWLLGTYAIGLVLALAFAGDRNEWVGTTLVMTVVPLCGLLAHRIWRRPWGPTALFVLLAVTFGAYWYRAFLAWWGDTLRDRVPLWRPLSWHNQSAMLMGAFGAAGLAMAGVGRRYVATAGALIAAGGLAGAWLSGSRGGLAATVVAAAVAAVGALRSGGARRAAVGVGASALLAMGVVAGLNAMIPEGSVIQDRTGNFEGASTNPLENRSGSAVGNFEARLKHMDAAVGMFLADPVTGGGLGSYRRLALQHTSPDANLTASAHNEYLEVPAEMGFVGGLGFIGLHVLVAGAALGTVWRRREVAEDEIRGPLQAGAAALVVGIGVHAAVDFDWTFPVLPVLLAVGAAMLVREPTLVPAEMPPPHDGDGDEHTAGRRSLAWLLALPLALALGAAVWGTFEERAVASGAEGLSAEEFAALPLPWQGDRLSRHALDLSRRGEHELAAATIQEAMDWSPAVPSYRAVAQIVLYRAGAIEADAFIGRVLAIEPGFGSINLAAEALIDEGDLAIARAVTEDLLATYDDYLAQGIDAVRAETWYLRAEVEAVGGDCDEAAEQIARSVNLGHIPVGAVVREFEPLRGTCPDVLVQVAALLGIGEDGSSEAA